jgi:predicted aldo/keto reductase-like oxidoreductase
MDRRDFLKKMSSATGILASQKLISGTALVSFAQTGGTERSTDMIYRTLGGTGEKISAIGMGGYHMGRPQTDEEATRIIRTGIDKGITFMDNSWDYNGGVSEIRMGKALRDGYRGKVFLMTKIDGRTKESAAKQIDESLKRLQTDHVDLMQFHEIIRLEDPDRIFAKGGAIEAMEDAKKAGKVKYIGFTGHKDPLVHLRMLEIAAAHNFRFDAVQMPLNAMDAHFRSFQHLVLPILVKENIGVIGMKSMADGHVLKSGSVTPVECLHYAMNLPTSTVVTGIDKMEILDQALNAAATFKPMSEQKVQALLAKTTQVALSGKFEPFKTSSIFDSTARNPEWLG